MPVASDDEDDESDAVGRRLKDENVSCFVCNINNNNNHLTASFPELPG